MYYSKLCLHCLSAYVTTDNDVVAMLARSWPSYYFISLRGQTVGHVAKFCLYISCHAVRLFSDLDCTMGSLGVCMDTARIRVLHCNLQKQRLCLNNSLRTLSSTRNYGTRSNLSSIARLSSNRNRLNTPTDTRTTWLRQYATPSSAAKPDPARALHNEPDDRPSELDEAVSHVKKNQRKTPWQREGSQTPPVQRERNASAMTKGKL
jgi:hypothetical protein